MPEDQSNQVAWWGSFEFEDDHAGRWVVGPSILWIHRSEHSWYIIHSEAADAVAAEVSVDTPKPISQSELSLENLPPGATVARFSFQRADRLVNVLPALADRAVVVQPEVPLYILPDEEVTIYVSTPLWMQIEVGSPGRLLRDIPSQRPSDTWFGPSTRDGELCYAVKTTGRLKLQNLAPRLHRAVTPIRVRNKATLALHIDRVQLPVQYLSLYKGGGGLLWTDSISMDREPGGELTTVRFDRETPSEAGGARLIRGPRVEVRTNVITRTFSSFFNRLAVED